MLYSIYRKNNVYCSVLYDIFLGKLNDFLDQLKRSTKRNVIGYYFVSGGKFFGKYRAVCRKNSNPFMLVFKRNCVHVVFDEKKFIINDLLHTKEQLITEIANIINSNN